VKETWKSVLRQAADCVAAQRWSLHCASINSSVQSTGRKVELSEKSTAKTLATLMVELTTNCCGCFSLAQGVTIVAGLDLVSNPVTHPYSIEQSHV